MSRGLLDGARALKVVEIRRGEARAYRIDLNACRLEFDGEGERIALRAVFEGL